MSAVDVLAVMDSASLSLANAGDARSAIKANQARAAVAELIEAAGLRVMWINGSYYVVHADGKTAFSNIPQTAEGADAERAEAIRAALARCKGEQA